MSRLALLVLEQACVAFEGEGKGDLATLVRVAVEEIASRPSPEGDLVPIPADVWRRIKSATGYGSFECDEHVAAAIEGLLKETRIAMPYANEIEDLVRALAPIAEFEIDERFDPMESWRGIVTALQERMRGLTKDLDRSSDLADGVTDELETVRKEREEWKSFYQAAVKALGDDFFLFEDDTAADAIARIIRQRNTEDAAGKRQFDMIQGLREEVARLNEQLDAAMQRAVMPTFEPEPDLAFLETPLPAAEPCPALADRLDGRQPVTAPPTADAPEPGDVAPTPEEPKGEPVDPAVGTGGFVAAVPAPAALTPKPGRKPRAAAPPPDTASAVVVMTGGWNLYASPEQAVAIARMVVAGSSPETIAKELDAKPADVAAVRDLVSADLPRVRRMLPMQREQWLTNKGKVWRKSFEGKEAAAHG